MNSKTIKFFIAAIIFILFFFYLNYMTILPCSEWFQIQLNNFQSVFNKITDELIIPLIQTQIKEFIEKATIIKNSSSAVADAPHAPQPQDNWSEFLVEKVLNMFKPLIEPVTVDYSNEILATQIHGIAIFLFLLSLMIIILILSFISNILIFAYSENLLNYFTNKYIKFYISWTRKFIGIEIFFLGTSILYFMYWLSYGIHFIATHPIVF